MIPPHPHVYQCPASKMHFVKGTKVPVYRLWDWHRKGVFFHVLVKRYPTLKPAQILDALSFSYDFPALMEEEYQAVRKALDPELEFHSMTQMNLPFHGR